MDFFQRWKLSENCDNQISRTTVGKCKLTFIWESLGVLDRVELILVDPVACYCEGGAQGGGGGGGSHQHHSRGRYPTSLRPWVLRLRYLHHIGQGWYSTFWSFRKRAHCCRWGLFFKCSILRNFHFQKTLKNDVFSKICYYLPFTSTKNREKKNFMGKFLFDLVEENHFVKVVFLTLSFKKI